MRFIKIIIGIFFPGTFFEIKECAGEFIPMVDGCYIFDAGVNKPIKCIGSFLCASFNNSESAKEVINRARLKYGKGKTTRIIKCAS